jgi:hypothetical protein
VRIGRIPPGSVLSVDAGTGLASDVRTAAGTVTAAAIPAAKTRRRESPVVPSRLGVASLAAPAIVVGVQSMDVGSDDSDWCDPERADVGAIDIGWVWRDAAAGVVRVTLAARPRLLCRRAALSGGGTAGRVEPGRRAGLPESTFLASRLHRGCQQPRGVAASLAPVEVRGCCSAPDQLEGSRSRLLA